MVYVSEAPFCLKHLLLLLGIISWLTSSISSDAFLNRNVRSASNNEQAKRVAIVQPEAVATENATPKTFTRYFVETAETHPPSRVYNENESSILVKGMINTFICLDHHTGHHTCNKLKEFKVYPARTSCEDVCLKIYIHYYENKDGDRTLQTQEACLYENKTVLTSIPKWSQVCRKVKRFCICSILNYLF